MDRLRHFGFLMKDVSRLSSQNFERHATGLNLTVAQCKVMVHLERHEGVSQARLAEVTDSDPMAIVRILDRMERDGWVERRPDPADRRARRLFLTQAAAPLLAEIWRIADAARAEALAGISAAERDQLMALLTRIQGNLLALVPQDASETEAPAAAEPAAPTSRTATRPSAARVKTKI